MPIFASPGSQRHTGDEFAAAVMALQQEGGIDGLVLDLRNNPGGVLGASVDVADVLLPRGLVICMEGRPGGKRLQHRGSIGDLLRGAPVAVLINEGSASGAEIVASALQDHERATVIGAQSYGKGSVQSLLPLAQDRALKLTTGYYFRPNGNSIHASGVVPGSGNGVRRRSGGACACVGGTEGPCCRGPPDKRTCRFRVTRLSAVQ